MKDINDGKTPDTRHLLDHVMDSVAMLGNTNWKLNMKRRELIKPELNPPYTRLCKEDITLSTKLFGDDLAKHLKDMSEAKKKSREADAKALSQQLQPGCSALSKKEF